MSIDEAAKRKPRKKGQKRKSSKHSDLYTDEDPKGTIHGLGFKDAATARKGRAIINKARRKHAHKVQAALVMKQRAKVAKERTKDPEKKKNLNAAYKVWSEFLEKLKAKTKKMKKNETHVLEEGVMDSIYEFYNDLSIGFIKQFPDLGKNIKHYGDYLTYVPGGIGSIAAVAVLITNVLEGDEEAAKASLALIIISLVGGKALAGGTGYIAREMRNFLPPAVLNRIGGGKELRMFIEDALAYLKQYGANKAEQKIAKDLRAAEKFIGDKSEFKKKITKFRMRTVPDPELKTKKVAEDVSLDEKKRKHPRYRPPRKDPKTGKYDNPCGKGFAPGAQSGVKTKIGPQSGRRVSNCEPIKKKKNEAVVEAVIKRLLSEQPYKTPGQEYIALFLDGPSRDKLTDTLDDPPPGWTLHADHMTVKFGSEGVPASYLGPATIRVVGVALNDRVMTAKVETDVPTQNNIPHITIATAPGAKPRESNDFSDSDFEEVQTFDLTGEVKPKFSDTLQKKMPKI